MLRRHFLYCCVGIAGAPLLTRAAFGDTAPNPATNGGAIEKIERSEAEWKKILPEDRYDILREEATERAFTSALNSEKRKGTYVCAGCDLELFTSDMKFDSGTGWPSFYTVLPGRVETKVDFKLILPRTEYHCARCGGHHGHLFKDGPQPTGLRYCNNGLALKFIPA
jgi:peptide-methionine (R)-S-oxide reductase